MRDLLLRFGDSLSTFEGLVPEGRQLYHDKHFCEGTGIVEPSDTWRGRVIGRFGGGGNSSSTSPIARTTRLPA